MSKAEEATNDFCTRCFKYDRCTKVQSECNIADSYQEGYEDGYHQAEKDLELSWEDMRELYIVFAEVDTEIELCKTDIKTETLGYYQEVLKRFKAQKGE